MQARVDWILIIFELKLYRKNSRLGPFFQNIFSFLMTMVRGCGKYNLDTTQPRPQRIFLLIALGTRLRYNCNPCDPQHGSLEVISPVQMVYRANLSSVVFFLLSFGNIT